MKRFFLLLLTIFCIACATETPKEYSLLKFVPQRTSLILQINDLESFRSELKNNQLLQSFKQPRFKEDFTDFVSYLSYIQPESKSLLCFSELGKNNFEYTFITKANPNIVVTDSLPDVTLKESLYQDVRIIETTRNNKTNYTFIADSIFVNSSSKLLIENCIRSYKKAVVPESLKKVYATIDEQKSATILANPRELHLLTTHIFPKANTDFLKDFGEQLALDVTIAPDELSFTGIATAKDSLNHALSSLENTSPRTSKIAKIIPPFFESFTTITFDDYTNFHPEIDNSMLDALEEISTFSFNDSKFTALRFVSASNEASDELETKEQFSTARTVPIYKNDDATLFQQHFEPFINEFDTSYYTILDEFIIFTDEKGTRDLALLIGAYKDEQTLAFQENFEKAMEFISDESSILCVLNTEKFKKTLSESTEQDYRKEILSINVADYPFAILQFTNEKGRDYAHVHGLLKRNNVEPTKNTVTQILNIVLDQPVASRPQFVKNHITKLQEIVVQDSQQQLYLISTEGKILWKKQLDGPILGSVSQVDLYKNGRLQLAITTPQTFYILDREGNDVDSYPAKATETYTQPVAIFDYDNRKNYRFVFTEGSKIVMRDKEGKKVNGFKFSGTETDLLFPPQHFRVVTKDYITLQESNGTIHILSRVGKPRITVKENILFSDNKMYIHNNLFTTSDENGNLIQIDGKGQIEKTKLEVEKNHDIAMTNKTFVSFSENKLRIKDKTVTLDFSSYSKPEIFLIRNKIYVAITDLDSQKVYLYNSNATLLPGFPAFGSSAIDLKNFDKDEKLEFVTKGEANTIVVYKMN